MRFDEKVEALQSLYEEWYECDRCPLCKPKGRTRNNVVFGEGNPDAKLVIVHGWTSKADDEEGSTLSGGSGELIDHLLAANNSSRKEVFLLNVVACRATDDKTLKTREPTKEEIAACLPRVHAILRIVDPDVVLLLDEIPRKALTKERKSTGRLAHSPKAYNSVDVLYEGSQILVRTTGLVTWQPGFLLRNWSLEPGGVVHKSYQTWEKAFSMMDTYNRLYRGIEPPDRSSE